MNIDEADLLINGYFRKKRNLKYIPTDVINVCLHYICNVVFWNLNENEVSNIEYGQSVREYNIYNDILKSVKFSCNLYPNGRSRRTANNVMFVLSIDASNIDNDISDFTIYYNFMHKSTNTKHSDIYKYDKLNMDNNYSGGSADNHGVNIIELYWPNGILKLHDCKDYKFCFVIDIIRINTNNHFFDSNMSDNNFIIDSKFRYKWNISDYYLKKLLRYKTRTGIEWTSPLFQYKSMVLFCIPNYNSTQIILGLRLLKLHHNVKELMIKFVFKQFVNKTLYYESNQVINTFSYDKNIYQLFAKKMQLNTINAIAFSIDMEIITVKGHNNNRIEKAHWSKYGIKIRKDSCIIQ